MVLEDENPVVIFIQYCSCKQVFVVILIACDLLPLSIVAFGVECIHILSHYTRICTAWARCGRSFNSARSTIFFNRF